MQMPTSIIEKVVRRNMEMFFATDEFTIKFNTPEGRGDSHCTITVMSIEPKTSDVTEVPWYHIDIELQKWHRLPSYSYKCMNAMTLTTYMFNDSLIELARVMNNIEKKINEISQIKREIFYIDEDCIVLGFSEIGIDHEDGSRDIIVNRDGVYSLIRFEKGEPITTEITIEKIREIIYAVSDVTSTDKIEFVGADTIMFVDMDEYEDDEE